MARTYSEAVRTVTENYLASLNPIAMPSDDDIAGDLIDQVAAVVELENSTRTRGSRWPMPTALSPFQIGAILLTKYQIRRIADGGIGQDESLDTLCVYMDSGENEGIYIDAQSFLEREIQRFNVHIKLAGYKEALKTILNNAKRVVRTSAKNLVPLKNGIFDTDTKTLLPFSPDYVFTSKASAAYNPLATNVTIVEPDGSQWDVESWMKSLSDDPAVVGLLWQVIGACLRVNMHWNKAAIFYSERGNNGKGTLCAFIKNIVGEKAYASIPLSKMSDEFSLSEIPHKSVIIADENDVGVFVDRVANFKSLVTNDSFYLNRKGLTPIVARFGGFVIQCMNELPKIRDRSDSFLRRLIMIPFTKCFTGCEKKYIKDDYLARKEVLEYAVYKVLHMDYDELSEPAACKELLHEFQVSNDTVLEFCEEFFPQFQWTFLPYDFLFELYKAWSFKMTPSGKPLSYKAFRHDLGAVVNQFKVWQDTPNPIYVGDKTGILEPLMDEYHLPDKCWHTSKEKIRGLVHVSALKAAKNSDDDDEENGEE